MTESTANPLPDAVVIPITVAEPTPGLLRELSVLLESRLSEGPLLPNDTALTELRLDGDGWYPKVVAAAGTAAAVAAAGTAVSVGAAAGPAAHLDGRKQPHYYVAIHVTAVWE
jgi:hypothetical protein